MKSKLHLRLFVAGSAPNSLAAITNLHAMRGALHDAELEVVDVLERPEQALADAVLVTPTLLRLSPGPECRVLGDLSDRLSVLSSLGVLEETAA